MPRRTLSELSACLLMSECASSAPMMAFMSSLWSRFHFDRPEAVRRGDVTRACADDQRCLVLCGANEEAATLWGA